MNSQDEIDLPSDYCSQFSADEFLKVCQELGLIEPTDREVSEDMWNDIPKYENSNW